MKCPKCEGKGYKEYEAGLIQIPCKECNATGEVHGWKLDQILERESKANDNIDAGARSDDKPIGSPDTGKPSKPKKRKARRKAAKKSS